MARERVARALGLGALVLVVREHEVVAAAVEVEALAEDRSDIAEHSMCQPGRPGPTATPTSGSPGFAAFHSAKSTGLRFSSSTSTRAPADSSRSSSVRCDSAP